MADQDRTLGGLLAEFDSAERLLAAAREARAAGYRKVDGFSPHPVEGLAECLGFRDRRVPLLALTGAVLGAALGFGLQVWAALDYPINVGGQPLVAWQAFMPITLSLCLLLGILFAISGMLLLNRLPRLHHPLFDIDGFRLTDPDRFFLAVFAADARFDRQGTREFLISLRPLNLHKLGVPEEGP